MHFLLALMQELLAGDKEEGSRRYAALAGQMGKPGGNGDGCHNRTQIEEDTDTPLPSIDRHLHLLDSRLLVPELQLMFRRVFQVTTKLS